MFDFLRDLKTFTLPWSTKVVVIALLALAVAVNVGLFLFSWERERTDLMSATVQLFGVMLPILLVTIVLARANTGVAALRRRTELFFLNTLPASLARTAEAPGEFYTPTPRRRPRPRSGTGTVLVNLTRDDCCADLLIYAPVEKGAWRAILLRLEINISRVNLNICIPASLADPTGAKDLEALGQALAQQFRHTLAGARGGRDAPAADGYAFLDAPLRRNVLGQSMVCLVGSRRLAAEFLWDSAAQLQFAQDLMFMARALLGEAPHLFPLIESAAAPLSAQPFVAALTPKSPESD